MTWITHNHILTLYDIILHTHTVWFALRYSDIHQPSHSIHTAPRSLLEIRPQQPWPPFPWPAAAVHVARSQQQPQHPPEHLPHPPTMHDPPLLQRVAECPSNCPTVQLPTCPTFPGRSLASAMSFCSMSITPLLPRLESISTNGWSLFGYYNYFKFESPIRI